MIGIQSGRKSDGARRARLANVICEFLEQRRLFSGIPTFQSSDLTAITSVGSVITNDPALQGPYQMPGTNAEVKDEITQSDGKRLVAGYADGNIIVARYNTDNTPDTTFGGGDGKSVNDMGTASDRALNMSLRPGGKIIVMGVTAGSGAAWQFAALRLNPNGTLDTTFADNGKLLSGLGRAPTYGGVSTVLADGRIHITGWDGTKSKGMEYNSDGQNGFDRLANVGGLRAQSVSSGSKFVWSGPSALGRLAASPFVGPKLVATQPLHAASLPTAQEGSPYSLDLSGGDGWDIDWGDNTTEPVTGHPLTASHIFADGPAPALITATSESIYLRSGETLIPDTAEQLTLVAGTLSIESGGTLDAKDNDLVVNSGDFATIQASVFEGYSAEPDATKTGIVSTAGQNAGGTTILALFKNALAGFGDWPPGSGIAVGANAIIGKYTYLGDTNMDGQVAPQDYTAVDANLGATGLDAGIAWFYGDTNFDVDVTAQDYTAIDGALGLGAENPLQSNGNSAPVAQVSQSVDVENVAPTSEIVNSPNIGAVNSSLTFEGAATDVSSTDQTAGFTYLWSLTKDGNPYNPNATTNQQNFTFTPTSPGIYEVTLTSTDKDSDAASSLMQTVGVGNVTNGLLLASPTSQEIDLDWADATATDVHGYTVYRSADSAFTPGIDTLLDITEESHYEDTGLTPNTTYYYVVRKLHDDGTETELTGDPAATTPSSDPHPTATPQNFAVHQINDLEIQLTWSPAGGNQTGFVIQRSADGVNFVDFSTITDPKANAWTDRNPASGQNYYRIASSNSVGKSSYTPIQHDRVDSMGTQAMIVIVGGHEQTMSHLDHNAGSATATNGEGAGMGDLAKKLRAQGYNVFLFAEFQNEDVGLDGRGKALDQIKKEIARGVSSIVLIGYSHGGSACYHISQRLHEDVASFLYQIPYVAYVDAVVRSTAGDSKAEYVNAFPETHAPVGMNSGDNFFSQQEVYGFLPRGDSISGMNNTGRIATDSGAYINHLKMDDQPSIWNTIKRDIPFPPGF